MSRTHFVTRLLSWLVVVSMLLQSLAPAIALAQEPDGGSGGTVLLPLIAGGARLASTATDTIFRTRVTVATAAQWRDLERMNPVFLERGPDWALLLVDDAQMEDLARWRYNPEGTDTLEALVTANDAGGRMAAAFAPLLAMASDLRAALAADKAAASIDANAGARRADQPRASLRAALHGLAADQLDFVTAASSTDADNDGLNDTLESYWCTNPAVADSDFDGASDGVEVQRLKDWMANKSYSYPSTGKPFQGWPPQKIGCYDDDSDAVPDIAEMVELGLSANRESTDRDKFDDGQELFGLTYCTGQGGFCSYGPLPRNEDWGVIFAEMPSWVKAPGNHPLVAAYPVPGVDIQPSTITVEPVTKISTELGEMEQKTQTYSESVMDGTSSSVTDAETWNNWTEVSETRPQVRHSELDPLFARAEPGQSLMEWRLGDFRFKFEPKIDVCVPVAKIFVDICAGELAFDPLVGEQKTIELPPDLELPPGYSIGDSFNFDTPAMKDALKGCKLDATGLLVCDKVEPAPAEIAARSDDPAISYQDKNRGESGTQYGGSGSQITVARTYQVSAPPVRFPPTQTKTNGSSKGGYRETTHTDYEEHTVTNGEAFTTGKDWSTATAVDSAHAADLWFTYKVRNIGTEYAHQIKKLAFNIYIGADVNPACTYFLATGTCGTPGDTVLFENFMPNEEHVFTSSRIPISLEQMKAIDLGGPIRIVVEDFSYGIDELFYQESTNAGVIIAMEDGTADGDETIDTYLIPTWGSETVLQVLARYFPHETDANGMMTAIWTPEYRSDTPGWCQAPRRPTDQPSKALWCKHALSTADWWNVYTDGLGDGSEGFQDTLATPGATALFRFNQDSDLDGFSDRSEDRLGTDPNDASSFPKPELLAGMHNIRSGNRATSTLSLLNTGFFDAYGVEAVMVAPDDSVTIDNNTVGGSGRVRSQKQVIVGSRILLQSPLPAPWLQANHAVPAGGGYYIGDVDRIYTFTVNCGTAGGCKVGEGSWTLGWNDGKGASGSLNFGAGYASPTSLTVGVLGLALALYSGSVQNGESFTVAANTPRDTFQYTINREPFTEPIVIVSYNDPQGNHRFVVPSQAMTLTAPTTNLQPFAGQMLQDVGVEIVTSAPFNAGVNAVNLLVNNPADATLQGAHLFLEFINISGTVVSEVPTDVTLPPGPTYTPVSFDSSAFSLPFNLAEDYIVMAFLTDYQGNILDTAGRPLSSFQVDPMPNLAVDVETLTWNFGAVPQGALLKHQPALANVGYGSLYTYLTPAPGLSLVQRAAVVGAANLAGYELVLRTTELPVGAYDQSATLKTSDSAQPTLTVRVQGTVIAATGDTAGGLQRPLDVPVTVQGPKNLGDWVEFTHALGPEPQSLHPVRVHSADYVTLYGVGKYATDFGAGTASYDMFGDGRDGELIVNSGQTLVLNQTRVSVSASGTTASPANSVGFAAGDVVLFYQTQSTANVGRWELAQIAAINSSTNWTLNKPLGYSYDNVNGRAQVVKVPQYHNVSVQSGGTLTAPSWDGATGGVLIFRANGTVTIAGTLSVNGSSGNNATGYGSVAGATGGGFRGGAGVAYSNYETGGNGFAGEGTIGSGTRQFTANGNGGGGGLNNKSGFSAGAGGGNGQSGANGTGAGGDYDGFQHAYGGGTAGSDDLTTMVFGGGGGGVSLYSTISQGFGSGASGGGTIFVSGKTVTVTGAISTRGGNASSGGGGAGSGGSILLKTDTVNVGVNLLTAAGGTPVWWAGQGGLGRIRIEHCQSMVGSTASPVASTQKLNCYVTEQTETTPFTTGRLNLPENITTSKTYQVQYGRRLAQAASTPQQTTLRVPAGMMSNVTLDTLISQLPANATFALDIGADGSNEWAGTVANNSTNNSPDLATAFNTYWVAQGAPVAGTLDVPVKVTLSQAGQVLLTNLQVTTAGSKQRTLRLAAGTVDMATLNLALGGSGQQAISIAVDVGADGSLDWTSTVSTTLPVRLTTGNVAAAVNSYLAGKTGLVDVPLRIFVAPDLPVALYDANIQMQPAVDLATIGLAAGSAIRSLRQSASATYESSDIIPLNATVSNPGTVDSGPLTVAFFAYAAGWGDWYIGSAFVANLAPGASTQVAIDWDTTGFSGAVAVKAIVNPYRNTAETSYANNTITATMQVNVFDLGDINGDNGINVLDLQRQINMILHPTPLDGALYPQNQWLRGDIDSNSVWNVLDLQRLINLIQGQ